MLAPFKSHTWRLAHDRGLVIGMPGRLMGVINATPDSFSDGGMFGVPQQVAEHACKLVEQGAAIIDIGAESTKPGATEVDAQKETQRLMPALEAVLDRLPEVPVSVDTYRASTARKALAAGAHIVNDVWGLQRDPEIARVASDFGAGLVIMHTNRERDALDDVIADQRSYFERSLDIATKAGIGRDQIVLDPGFGFGKETAEMNFELLARFEELLDLGFPILVGTSRKRFLGASIGLEPKQRDQATAATTSLLRSKGAAIFRVHDVAANAEALRISDAMLMQLR